MNKAILGVESIIIIITFIIVIIITTMPKDNYQFLVGWLKALPANIPKFVAADAIKLFHRKHLR